MFKIASHFLGTLPTSSKSRQLQVDWDHFFVLFEAILKRLPLLEDSFLGQLTNGPEAFSPDGQWIIGQSPELQNYYVAAAMRSIGAGAAGGVGEAIANHIAEGRPPFDMYNLVIFALKRFTILKRIVRSTSCQKCYKERFISMCFVE